MNRGSVSIRLNPFKGLLGPEGTPVPWNRYGRILEERPVFTLDPLFHAGCYYVQDSSAMFVGYLFREVLAGRKGLRVLDLCAAPGGKTTDLAASLREVAGDDFLLVSNEVMRQRVSILADNVAIWGDPNVIVSSYDPAFFGQRMAGFFDIIVADVPCSGEGMFRKDPRAQQEWSEQTVELCAARQKRILADVWPALKQGGTLIYSTCTYEERENDDNLRWAAEELGGDVMPAVDRFPENGVRPTEFGNILKVGEVPGEGQWAGMLTKTAPTRTVRNACDSLRPVWSRPSKGEMKGGKLIPNADYALSIGADLSGFESAEVDLKTALSFLHRDSILLPDSPKGFVVIRYRGQALGFVNNLGTRCNNLHPQSRRILMDIH